jgi:uncharacterized protein YegP (UPF0339 family)
MDEVQLFKDESGEWRWRRRSENGKIVATSGEGYHNYTDAISMAEDVNGADQVEWTSEE